MVLMTNAVRVCVMSLKVSSVGSCFVCLNIKISQIFLCFLLCYCTKWIYYKFFIFLCRLFLKFSVLFAIGIWHISILKLWCLGNKCFWTADRRAAGDRSRPHQEASQACCSWSGTTVSHPGARNAHDEHCQSPVTVRQFGLHFWFHGLWTDRKKRKWVFFYCVQLFLINI